MLHGQLRQDTRGAEETFQALPAVLITIVVVGLVFGALSAAADGARERQAQDRARLQAEIFVASLPADRALEAPGGAVAWAGAESLAAGQRSLSFVPAGACIASLLDAVSGQERFLLGSVESLSPACVTSWLPVPIVRDDGTTSPGLLRAGVVRG